MARRPRRTYRTATFDPETARRRNRFLILMVLVLLVFLVFHNWRNEQRFRAGAQRQHVRDAFLEIGGALDRYRIDNGAYPTETPGIYPLNEWTQLTTPHSYLWDGDVARDPFADDGYRVAILDTIPTRWLLMSAGPDRQWNLTDIPENALSKGDDLRQFISELQYDPTNGILSAGDILLLGK